MARMAAEPLSARNAEPLRHAAFHTHAPRLPGAELPGRSRLRRQHAHLRGAPASQSGHRPPTPVP